MKSNGILSPVLNDVIMYELDQFEKDLKSPSELYIMSEESSAQK